MCKPLHPKNGSVHSSLGTKKILTLGVCVAQASYSPHALEAIHRDGTLHTQYYPRTVSSRKGSRASMYTSPSDTIIYHWTVLGGGQLPLQPASSVKAERSPDWSVNFGSTGNESTPAVPAPTWNENTPGPIACSRSTCSMGLPLRQAMIRSGFSASTASRSSRL